MKTYDDVVMELGDVVEFHQHRYSRELNAVVTPNVQWLDIGAGDRIHQAWSGVTEAELAGRAAMVVGCDLEPEHLRRNRSLTSAVVANGYRLPFADSSFDIVTANMVLEHLEQPATLFGEVSRVLRKRGHFVFVTPNVHHPIIRGASILLSRRIRKVMARLIEQRNDEDIFPTFYRANSVGALRRFGTNAGFAIERLEIFNSFPFVRRPIAALRLEAWWIRATRNGPLNRLGSNVIGVLRRT